MALESDSTDLGINELGFHTLDTEGLLLGQHVLHDNDIEDHSMLSIDELTQGRSVNNDETEFHGLDLEINEHIGIDSGNENNSQLHSEVPTTAGDDEDSILLSGKKGKTKKSKKKKPLIAHSQEVNDPNNPNSKVVTKAKKWEQRRIQVKTLEGEFTVTMWTSGKLEHELRYSL